MFYKKPQANTDHQSYTPPERQTGADFFQNLPGTVKSDFIDEEWARVSGLAISVSTKLVASLHVLRKPSPQNLQLFSRCTCGIANIIRLRDMVFDLRAQIYAIDRGHEIHKSAPSRDIQCALYWEFGMYAPIYEHSVNVNVVSFVLVLNVLKSMLVWDCRAIWMFLSMRWWLLSSFENRILIAGFRRWCGQFWTLIESGFFSARKCPKACQKNLKEGCWRSEINFECSLSAVVQELFSSCMH